ncbi:hypothetical protein OXX69_002012 [Metschnikowia pulcherrima]
MQIDELIILPCHSIWKPKSNQSRGETPDEWFLASFQRDGHDHLCFVDHIKKSFIALKQNPNAILVISGGQTKAEAGPISEAFSYCDLAKRLIDECDGDLFERVFLEEYARDSFENVLFSFCRYHEIVERYPKQVTVVGFEFKRTRFVEYHFADALKFTGKVNYIGNWPTPGPEIDHDAYFADLHSSEKKNALDHFASDPFGHKEFLDAKKKSRDPFKRYHGYESSNERVADFLEVIRTVGRMTPDRYLRRRMPYWG